eukprot:TRINITY_DN39776_c0_g1_i1.p1 TRINITY_DN39776_c0_g1~~TRINITY_DN39776_c0_g1_i1.p1  ORF type:complete len:124 (+),score=11.69 TRINITY_DN39776_c0_g1_i1:192-563(+)
MKNVMQGGKKIQIMHYRVMINFPHIDCNFKSTISLYIQNYFVFQNTTRSQHFSTLDLVLGKPMYSALIPVSYTHLTLPTILLVQISVVAVSLKKKKTQNTCKTPFNIKKKQKRDERNNSKIKH